VKHARTRTTRDVARKQRRARARPTRAQRRARANVWSSLSREASTPERERRAEVKSALARTTTPANIPPPDVESNSSGTRERRDQFVTPPPTRVFGSLASDGNATTGNARGVSLTEVGPQGTPTHTTCGRQKSDRARASFSPSLSLSLVPSPFDHDLGAGAQRAASKSQHSILPRRERLRTSEV